MILTITLNPSMDYVYHTETFHLGEHNRMKNPTKMPGGKGINCARALSATTSSVLAFTLLGGENGKLINNFLAKETFTLDILEIDGESRNAITIMHDNSRQTEIVEDGPEIDSDMKDEIFKKIKDLLVTNKDINIVTINGSVNSQDGFLYNDLLEYIIEAVDRELTILMDLSKDSLINIYNSDTVVPNFIKPNEKEFGELIGKKVDSKDEILTHLKELETRIPYVLVSCGSSGALAKFNGNIYDVKIPSIEVVNPTGSGDSTVAGIAYAIDNKMTEPDIIKMGMAFGMANTAEDGVGVIDFNKVQDFFEKVEITQI